MSLAAACAADAAALAASDAHAAAIEAQASYHAANQPDMFRYATGPLLEQHKAAALAHAAAVEASARVLTTELNRLANERYGKPSAPHEVTSLRGAMTEARQTYLDTLPAAP